MDPILETTHKIANYFNLNLNDFDKKRLRHILDEFKETLPARVEYREVRKLIKTNCPKRSLDIIAEEVCQDHEIQPIQLKERRRSVHIVTARQDFALRAVQEGHLKVHVAAYLGLDHTTIIHYLYHRKPVL